MKGAYKKRRIVRKKGKTKKRKNKLKSIARLL